MAMKVSVLNFKGGVGKTTLSCSFAYWLADVKNLRVLLIDLDPQFNATQFYMTSTVYAGNYVTGSNPTIVDVFERRGLKEWLAGAAPGSDARPVVRVQAWTYIRTKEPAGSIDITPSTSLFADTMRNSAGKERRLAQFVALIDGDYDVILFDCPPTRSMATDAALLAGDRVIVPVKPDTWSQIGLTLLERSLRDFAERYERQPQVDAIVLTDVYDNSQIHTEQIEKVRGEAKRRGWQVCGHVMSHSNSYIRSAQDGVPIYATPHARSWRRAEFRFLADELYSLLSAERVQA